MKRFLNEHGEYQYNKLTLAEIDDEIAAAFDASEDVKGWQEIAYSERHLRLLYAKKCNLMEEKASTALEGA